MVDTFQMQLIYFSLGLKASYLSIFFLSVVSLLTLFVNITPDAIGIKEGISYIILIRKYNIEDKNKI